MQTTCDRAFDLLCKHPEATFRGATGTIEIRRRIAAPGSLSDGTRIITVRPCDRIRWLVVELGWKTIAEIDQRDYWDKPEAMAIAVMLAIEKFCQTYATEPGADAKPQLVIPGAERISTAQLLARRMDQPKRAKCDQREPGGLFSATVRDQLNLF